MTPDEEAQRRIRLSRRGRKREGAVRVHWAVRPETRQFVESQVQPRSSEAAEPDLSSAGKVVDELVRKSKTPE